MKLTRNNLSMAAFMAALLMFAIACGETPSVDAPQATTAPTHAPETAVVEPTEAPNRDSLQEEYDYLLELLDILDRYSTHSDDMALLFNEAGNDPMVIFDPIWREDFAVIDARIRNVNNQVRSMDPPDRYSEPHSDLVSAADDMDSALDYFEDGIDNVDPDAIDRGADYLLEASDHIVDASLKVEALD